MMDKMNKDHPGWSEWAEQLEQERKNQTIQVQMQVAMAIEKSPQAFGLSKAEAKRMGSAGVRRMADGIAEALGRDTGLLLIQRPDIADKKFDAYFWWKHTWNKFRELGHLSSMYFSRDLYVSLTRYPFGQFTDMDCNVDLDPDPDLPPPTHTGLRVVK